MWQRSCQGHGKGMHVEFAEYMWDRLLLSKSDFFTQSSFQIEYKE